MADATHGYTILISLLVGCNQCYQNATLQRLQNFSFPHRSVYIGIAKLKTSAMQKLGNCGVENDVNIVYWV